MNGCLSVKHDLHKQLSVCIKNLESTSNTDVVCVIDLNSTIVLYLFYN